ncbi:MAG TPA: hypothetical protein VMM13_02040 [Euzebya sp.]|nr:hypothetical protein [Euzebya sp.]
MAKTDLMFDVRLPGGSPTALIKALTTTDGIAAFWTSGVRGDAATGQRVELDFPAPDGTARYELSTTAATEDAVTWAYVGGDNPAWMGTQMTFRVVGPSPMGGDATMVSFIHAEFEGEAAQSVPFITYIWAQILGRLKTHVEDGAVNPFFDPAG